MRRAARTRASYEALRRYLALHARLPNRGPEEMTVAYADRVRMCTRAQGRAADVLYFMAVHADAQRIVRGVSIQVIADGFAVSWRYAKYLLQQLRELGELETIARGGGTRGPNTYRVTVSLPPD